MTWAPRAAAIATLSTAAVLGAQSQTPSAPTHRFEAVSIKRNTSSNGPMTLNQSTPGRFTATRVTPLLLILNNSPFDSDHLINVPDWIRNEQYDIVATTGEPVPPASEIPALVLAMLGQRVVILRALRLPLTWWNLLIAPRDR